MIADEQNCVGRSFICPRVMVPVRSLREASEIDGQIDVLLLLAGVDHTSEVCGRNVLEDSH